MDETVILPPPGQSSGFVSRGCASRGLEHRSDCAKDLALVNVIDTNAADIRQQVGVNGAEGRLVSREEGSEGRVISRSEGLETRREVREDGHETRDRVHLGDAETRLLVKNFGELNLSATERFALFNHRAIEDVQHGQCKTDSLIADYGYRNLLQAKDLQKDILQEACDTREVVKDKAQILERQASDQFAVVTRQAAENACKTEIMILKSENAVSKQLAECCCELKELVREKADETDMLIRKLDSDRLRDQLREAQEELNLVRLRSTLPPLPVASIAI